MRFQQVALPVMTAAGPPRCDRQRCFFHGLADRVLELIHALVERGGNGEHGDPF